MKHDTPNRDTCGFYPMHLYLGADFEAAEAIMSAVCDFSLAELGLADVTAAHLDLLRPLDLADFLAAKAVVERFNARRVPAGASKSFRVVPDDRLIAAVYTWLHYCAGRDVGDPDESIVRADQGEQRHFLFAVSRTTRDVRRAA